MAVQIGMLLSMIWKTISKQMPQKMEPALAIAFFLLIFFIPATKNTQIMSDDKNIRGPQDRSRINLQEDYEVRYWTEKFRITKEVLTEAVQEVGSVASRVEDWLRTQGKM